MFFNRVIFRYLVCLSVAWFLILWIKLTFAGFVSNGPLQPLAVVYIWLWWPTALFVIVGEKKRLNDERKRISGDNKHDLGGEKE